MRSPPPAIRRTIWSISPAAIGRQFVFKPILAEMTATVGEEACAVVCGTRNPPACIRSSAEPNIEGDGSSNEQTDETVRRVDDLDGGICRLLLYAYLVGQALEPVELSGPLRSLLSEVERDLTAHRIAVERHRGALGSLGNGAAERSGLMIGISGRTRIVPDVVHDDCSGQLRSTKSS